MNTPTVTVAPFTYENGDLSYLVMFNGQMVTEAHSLDQAIANLLETFLVDALTGEEDDDR